MGCKWWGGMRREGWGERKEKLRSLNIDVKKKQRDDLALMSFAIFGVTPPHEHNFSEKRCCCQVSRGFLCLPLRRSCLPACVSADMNIQLRRVNKVLHPGPNKGIKLINSGPRCEMTVWITSCICFFQFNQTKWSRKDMVNVFLHTATR